MAVNLSMLAGAGAQFFDNSGVILSGGLLYTYVAGTTTPQAAYTSNSGSTTHSNPIVLDSAGRVASGGEIWLTDAIAYKFVLKTSTGITIGTYDNVTGNGSGIYSTFAASSGSSLIGYQPAGTGAVQTTVQAKLRQTVSVMDFGATGNGTTDDTAAFTNAATYAASINGDVYLPPPAATYKLSSNPTVPTNVNFQGSLTWLSGAGVLPVEQFIALSESISPNVFSIKSLNYSETASNETTRKWAVCGWVNYKNSPASGYAGTATDAVGVDGRGIASVANGRVWGIVGLGQLNTGVSGVAQAYSAEFDINNNYANITAFDASPTAKGIVIASGGTYQPETAALVIATKTPTNTLGDNRFFAGWRFYQDCYKEFGIHFDDNCKNVAIRIPSTAIGVRFTKSNTYNFDFSLNDISYRGQIFAPVGKGIDVLKSTGSQLIGINETFVNFNVPLCQKTNTQTVPTSLDATAANIFSISTAGTISGGIIQGVDGQRITIINASSGTVNVSKNANMRTIGGATVALAPLQLVEFVYASPTYFQVGAPVSLA